MSGPRSQAAFVRTAALAALLAASPWASAQERRADYVASEDEGAVELGEPKAAGKVERAGWTDKFGDSRDLRGGRDDRDFGRAAYDRYDKVERTRSGDYERTAYQLPGPQLPGLPDELAAGARVGPDNSPPIYERYTVNTSADRPLKIDYTFLGNSEVHAPPRGTVTMQELSFSYRMRFPLADWGTLNVTPLFHVTFLDGPTGHDPVLPPQVYKLAADLKWDYRFGDRYQFSAAITPGIWSDFRGIDGEDFRIPTRLLLSYRVNDGLYIGGGVFYTDNYYDNLLPILGVLWEIDDRWKVEVTMPRGRLVYRLHEDVQFYTGLEGGGDTYTIRTDGVPGQYQYRDMRWFVGGEYGNFLRATIFAEMGMAFNRRMRTETDGVDDRNLDNCFYLRAGARF